MKFELDPQRKNPQRDGARVPPPTADDVERRRLVVLLATLPAIVAAWVGDEPERLALLRRHYVGGVPLESEEQWQQVDEFEGVLRDRLQLNYSVESPVDEPRWHQVQTLLRGVPFRTLIFGTADTDPH